MSIFSNSKSALKKSVLILAFMAPFSALAQLQVGPSLGFSGNTFAGFNNSAPGKGDPFLGYNLGLTGFGHISERSLLKGSIKYAREGFNVEDVNIDEQFRFNVLKLDFSYGIKTGNWSFTAGPALRLLLGAERSDDLVSDLDVKDGWESMVAAYNLGVNYHSTKYQIYVSYESSFDDITQTVVREFNDFTRYNPGSVKYQQLNVGINFFIWDFSKKEEDEEQ